MKKRSIKRRTVLCDVGDGRVHVGEAEDVGEQARDGDGEVVHSDATLASGGSVEHGALEVSVDLLVQLAFVLDTSGDGLVGVHGSELEIGDIALEEVAKMIGDAKP